jgi:hypothetical protein
MNPDELRDFLLREFLMLVSELRSDGWSFFYERVTPGTRIITVRQSSPTANVRLLRAISNRRGGPSYQPFIGGQQELWQLVEEEIRLYLEHFAEPVA